MEENISKDTENISAGNAEDKYILKVENLSKHFAKVEALHDVSLNIKRGSITGLLGPNGAGKTTLLRVINGILAKENGTVLIDGKETSLKTARTIGYMPEERGLYDGMTIENQILYFGELKGGDRKRMREVMHEYLELFNLKGQEHRKIKELSKGNQQKVQIITTLVHEPSLVILDEPFSGFDPINGALLTELIERLHAKGVTVILSSHNMPAVEEMCSDIALINHGTLLVEGEIQDIKEAYKNDELFVTTVDPLNIALMENSGLIEKVEPTHTKQRRKGYAYLIKKKGNVSNLELIKEIAIQSEIVQFEEALPSLQEIFIKIVGNDSAAEEAPSKNQ